MILFIAKAILFWVGTAAFLWAVGANGIASPGLLAKGYGSFVLLVAAGYTFFFVPAAIRRDAAEML